MSITTWLPEVWSTRLLRYLLPNLVMAQPRCMNRDWEGEIKGPGDTVHIRKFGDGAAIRDYTRGTAMAAPDRPGEGTTLDLTVDQQSAFYIAVDDVDAVQADIALLDRYMERTARNLAVKLDTFAAGKFLAAPLAANVLGTDATPLVIDHAGGTGKITPYQFCVQARRALGRQSAPMTDLWMVVNANIEAEFLQDPVFVNGGVAAAENFDAASAIRQGQIGSLAGFNILRTEAITASEGSGGTKVPNHKVIYGAGNYALTWADQIVKTEAERLQGQFSDAVKGLSVYGAKIVETASYGVAHVADPTA